MIAASLVALVGGCGTATSGGGQDAASTSDDLPRISRVPMTTPTASGNDQEFADAVAALPINPDDARLLAISVCLAFKQNPGTTFASAVRQLAQQQAWTEAQSRTFLNATVDARCPEYRGGS